MPDTENPRSHIQPVPLPIPSQIPHLRSSNQKESCDWENYERRRHQMSKCGYRSVIYKPYHPVGEVFLDDTKLNLSALRYEQIKPNKTTTHIWARNPTLWGGTYIYGLYKGVPHPPGVISCCMLLYISSHCCTFYVVSSTWMLSRPFFLRHLVYLSRQSISSSLPTMFLFVLIISSEKLTLC